MDVDSALWTIRALKDERSRGHSLHHASVKSEATAACTFVVGERINRVDPAPRAHGSGTFAGNVARTHDVGTTICDMRLTTDDRAKDHDS